MTSGVYLLRDTLAGRAYVGASANIEQRYDFQLVMLRGLHPDRPRPTRADEEALATLLFYAEGPDGERRVQEALVQDRITSRGEDVFPLEVLETIDGADPRRLVDAEQHWISRLQEDGQRYEPAASLRVPDAWLAELEALGDEVAAEVLTLFDALECRAGSGEGDANLPTADELQAAHEAAARAIGRVSVFAHERGIPLVTDPWVELYGPGHAPNVRRVLRGLTLSGERMARLQAQPRQPRSDRPSTKKITMPWEPDTIYPAPNLHGHGTRNLARTVAGDVDWRPSTSSSGVLEALVGETPIAMVDLSPGREGEALMEILHQVVNPRTIQTMVGVCRLIWEKTERQPFNRMATVRLGELARAAGYDPGPKRYVDPEIRRRLGRELKALTSITTLAAEGPFNRKTHQRPPAWVAPLLVIPAILLEQLLDEEQPAPREIDVMLGRNWATAYTETDLVQIAPGFMQLDGDSAIRLAWYYQTEFRYRMTDQRLAFTRPISNICESAGIADGGSTHRGRFLTRLEKWHAELVAAGVLGSYSRNPAPGEHGKHTEPAEIWARGAYTVAPPQTIVDAYAIARENARIRERRKRLPDPKRRPT